jgi:branched-subunit amino acid ABC-type transport system permease component
VIQTLVAAVGFAIVTASILALAAVGFTLQFGISGIFNLAFGEVLTMSAYVAYAGNQVGLTSWEGFLVGAAFGAIVTLLIHRVVYRPYARRGRSPFQMIVVAIGVSLILQNVLLAGWGPNFFSLKPYGSREVRWGALALTEEQLTIVILAVTAMAALHLLLKYSRLGKAMRATSVNPMLARSSAIPADRIADLAWLISGALCGMAGVALALNVTTFTNTTGATFLLPIVAAAVLGGIGQPYGALLGAVTIGLVSEITATVFAPAYKDAVAFGVLILVLLIRPQGIVSDIAQRKGVVRVR